MKKIITILLLFLTIGLHAQPAGNLDPSFGNSGKVLTSITSGQDKAYGVQIQTDGKIVVAGYSTSTITGKDFTLIRYNANGTLDSTFGNTGIVTKDLQLGSDDVAFCIALQTDGKIILGGYSDNGSNKNAAIIRYQINGIIDSTFGNNGIVLTDYDSLKQDEIHVIKIHPLTGNIIAGGSAIASSSVSKPVVARYLSNGIIDSTFNTKGIRLLTFTTNDNQYYHSVEDLVVLSNGKISAIGWKDFPTSSWSSDYWACRINSNGTMDNTFSGDGVNTYNGSFNGNDRAYSMILKTNNNILMAGGGYVTTLRYDFTIIELNADGTAGTWSSKADFDSNLDDIAYGLAEDNNGKFVLAGSSGNTTSKSFAVARINTDNTLDNTFATTGKVITTFGSNAINECYDIKVQSDNKIVAVGYSGNDIAIARYLGNITPQLDNFQLLLPANQAVNQNYSSILFDWSDAFGATSYMLEIDTNQTFTASPQTFTITASTKVINNLLPNTHYYWRVKSSDGTNWGQYSSVWSFTTNTLENFNLLLPSNNASNQNFSSLLLDWSDAIGASTYKLEIDSSQTFSYNPQTLTSNNSTLTITNLQPSTNYYWHVKASNGSLWGQWSSIWKFTTKQDFSAIIENEFIDLNIYPNPVEKFINIEIDQLLIGSNFYIFDYTGKQLITGNICDRVTKVSFENLMPGIYFIQIGKLVKRTFKIVKE
jgi:uncharacterized delta-60 repeat protein